jgi:hypothetical protein
LFLAQHARQAVEPLTWERLVLFGILVVVLLAPGAWVPYVLLRSKKDEAK